MKRASDVLSDEDMNVPSIKRVRPNVIIIESSDDDEVEQTPAYKPAGPNVIEIMSDDESAEQTPTVAIESDDERDDQKQLALFRPETDADSESESDSEADELVPVAVDDTMARAAQRIVASWKSLTASAVQFKEPLSAVASCWTKPPESLHYMQDSATAARWKTLMFSDKYPLAVVSFGMSIPFLQKEVELKCDSAKARQDDIDATLRTQEQQLVKIDRSSASERAKRHAMADVEQSMQKLMDERKKLQSQQTEARRDLKKRIIAERQYLRTLLTHMERQRLATVSAEQSASQCLFAVIVTDMTHVYELTLRSNYYLVGTVLDMGFCYVCVSPTLMSFVRNGKSWQDIDRSPVDRAVVQRFLTKLDEGRSSFDNDTLAALGLQNGLRCDVFTPGSYLSMPSYARRVSDANKARELGPVFGETTDKPRLIVLDGLAFKAATPSDVRRIVCTALVAHVRIMHDIIVWKADAAPWDGLTNRKAEAANWSFVTDAVVVDGSTYSIVPAFAGGKTNKSSRGFPADLYPERKTAANGVSAAPSTAPIGNNFELWAQNLVVDYVAADEPENATRMQKVAWLYRRGEPVAVQVDDAQSVILGDFGIELAREWAFINRRGVLVSEILDQLFASYTRLMQTIAAADAYSQSSRQEEQRYLNFVYNRVLDQLYAQYQAAKKNHRRGGARK